jgi:Stage III sporulation protein AC/AD protein family.
LDILKVGIIGIIGVLLALFLKGTKSQFAIYISLGTCLLIIFYSISKLEYIINTINTIMGYISIEMDYLLILAKIVGITYIAEFSSNICKDGGFSTIAGQIEVFSKLAILGVSMPILMALLETANSFLR